MGDIPLGAQGSFSLARDIEPTQNAVVSKRNIPADPGGGTVGNTAWRWPQAPAQAAAVTSASAGGPDPMIMFPACH